MGGAAGREEQSSKLVGLERRKASGFQARFSRGERREPRPVSPPWQLSGLAWSGRVTTTPGGDSSSGAVFRHGIATWVPPTRVRLGRRRATHRCFGIDGGVGGSPQGSPGNRPSGEWVLWDFVPCACGLRPLGDDSVFDRVCVAEVGRAHLDRVSSGRKAWRWVV